MVLKHSPWTLPSPLLPESWHDLTSTSLQVAHRPCRSVGGSPLPDFWYFFPLFSGWVWILEWNQILTL